MQNGKLPVQIPNYLYKSTAGNEVLPSAPLSKMCCAGFVLGAPLGSQGQRCISLSSFSCHILKGTTGAAGGGIYLGLLLLSAPWDNTALLSLQVMQTCEAPPCLESSLTSPPSLIPPDTASSALGVDLPPGCTFTSIPSRASSCSKLTLQ